jgi:hypothetical protein
LRHLENNQQSDVERKLLFVALIIREGWVEYGLNVECSMRSRAPALSVMTDDSDEFEEHSAIVDYDEGLPRLLAEFYARMGRG